LAEGAQNSQRGVLRIFGLQVRNTPPQGFAHLIQIVVVDDIDFGSGMVSRGMSIPTSLRSEGMARAKSTVDN
jgi:hypothetical protein